MARVCLTDHTEYKYCPSCNNYDKTETWRLLFCSNNCRYIYRILTDYHDGKIDANTAYEQLQSFNLSNRKLWNQKLILDLENIEQALNTNVMTTSVIQPEEQVKIKPRRRKRRVIPKDLISETIVNDD